MITDFIINILMAIPNALLDLMPSLEIAIPEGAFSQLKSILSAMGTIVPAKALIPILLISIHIKFMQIGWAFIIRIKSFIPTMGA